MRRWIVKRKGMLVLTGAVLALSVLLGGMAGAKQSPPSSADAGRPGIETLPTLSPTKKVGGKGTGIVMNGLGPVELPPASPTSGNDPSSGGSYGGAGNQ